MNRKHSPAKAQFKTLVETLEPRIAPAGLLNESKFTSVVVGGSVLLDASGGTNDSQGLSTAFGTYAGSYLLYLNAGKALVFTTDLNGNGVLDPGEITGIALGVDSQGRAPNLTLFSDVHGDIVTNLNAGHNNFNLTDSDNNSANGRDGRALLGTGIDGITLRTLTNADIDTTVPGNTVVNRLALTHFSIYGNVVAGGDINGLSIDNSGQALLTSVFNTAESPYVSTGSLITVNGLMTGSAANYQYFHFTQNSPQILSGSTNGSTELVNTNIEGQIQPYAPLAGIHGGDISNVSAVATSTTFSIGLIASGVGGNGARGGNITNVTLHGDIGGYSILAGDGGQGATGGHGGNIINFQDLTTTNGQSIIHSGNGGRGTLGAGGDGGTASFGTTTNASDFEVVLGAGGPGFTRGGNGAGLTNTLLTAPDETLPLGSRLIGTWHDIGDVGNTHPIGNDPTTGLPIYSPEVLDFDGDGFGDAIFTTTNPDQVVVVFGDGAGGLQDNLGDFFSGVTQKTIVLKVPGGGAPAVTVGDFNGDGKPDIAVASGDLNNFGGINVYLNQIGDNVVNPVNPNNFTHNPLGDHPFGNPLHTAVPLLTGFGYYGQAGAILALAAGDYNGDGITDIAYAERVVVQGTLQQGQVVGLLFGDQATSLTTTPARVGAHVATTFVNGSIDNGLINNVTGRPEGTGFFYSNTAPVNGVGGLQVSSFFNNTSPVFLRATSTTNTNVPTTATGGLPLQQEYVISGIQSTREVDVYTANAPDPVTHIPAPSAVLNEVNSFLLGRVDVNRNLSTPAQNNVSSQDFVLQDFQLGDVDQDGLVDIVLLSSSPQTFLDTYRGNADHSFTRASTNPSPVPNNPGDNDGIDLANYPSVYPAAISLAISDPSQTGHFDGFAVTTLFTTPFPNSGIREFRLIPSVVPDPNPNPNPATGNPLGYDATLLDTAAYGISLTIDRQVNALDAFYTTAPSIDKATNTPLANLHPAPGYGVISPDVSDLRYVGVIFFSPAAPIPFERYLTENGISLYSGNGGDSTNGVGGNAGALGDGTLSVGTDATTTASIQIRYTASLAYSGSGLLQGGNGGNGFGGGGIGGDIAGVSARYNATNTGVIGITLTSFQAGNGGNGIGGNGGRGGGLSFLSIENGPNFYSGNGGNGINGGAGGAILGNQVGFDTSNLSVTLNTGIGGRGSNAGGAGGTINRWNSQIEGLGGFVDYETGAGGSASAGIGGAGGDILNSPLATALDRLDGSLVLLTGAGGSGLTGGAGGNIVNFTNQSTLQSAIPTTLDVQTGAGGTSVTGNGGAGGNVTSFQSNAIGITTITTDLQYNGLVRIIAGDGGVSYGAQGGAGGNLSNVNSTATSTPLVAAAGQGGAGLTVGGLGGSVSDSILNSAATQSGKLLIIAGKGGDALSALRQDVFLPTDNDVNDLAHAILAFGGQTGVGGDGGSVNNVRQPASTQTAVDIIAGNGGNTPNAGNAGSPTTGVGRGGSIGNIQLTGTLGSLQRNTSLGQIANPPIKSYSATDALTGVTTTSISDFVDFLASPDSFGGTFTLNDAVGNVGMVAGAAGTVRGGQPASNGVNGSVNGLTAGSILSIVAGSVDQVAPVAVLSNVVVSNPDGVLGADKSVNSPFGPNGQLDYYNTLGINVANLQSGYRLIDGAIFYTTIIQTPGQLIQGPRVIAG